MSDRSTRTGWTVLAGLILVFLGVWLLLERFFSPLLWPVAVVLGYLARIGWPLVLIGLGVLLILRARGGGWNPAGRRLMRSTRERWIGGVLGGFAQFLNVDPTLLRVVFAVLTLMTGVWSGVLLYIIAMIVIPEDTVVASSWATGSAANVPTPPPAAPPVPGWPTGSAPTPPAPPAPASATTAGEQPPEAPPVPPSPTVL